LKVKLSYILYMVYYTYCDMMMATKEMPGPCIKRNQKYLRSWVIMYQE